MTKGAPLGHLFLYAVPLLLANWLQLAYNAVDSIIAGRFIGHRQAVQNQRRGGHAQQCHGTAERRAEQQRRCQRLF